MGQLTTDAMPGDARVAGHISPQHALAELEKADVEESNRQERSTGEQPPRSMKDGDHQKRASIGQPGIESASGRDRSRGELPASFGTDEGSIDLSAVAPPRGAVEGSRVGTEGDPTGSEEADLGSGSSANAETTDRS